MSSLWPYNNWFYISDSRLQYWHGSGLTTQCLKPCKKFSEDITHIYINVRKIGPEENCTWLGLGFGLALRVVLGLGGYFPRGQLS